ncbi:MAG: VWA domain-containing protein, partial [Sulfurimonas sp.]|nr:VWA domain-containing protein [Sulfurimonas sp.]
VEDAIKENPEDYKVEIISTTTGGYEAVSLGNTSVTTTITDDDSITVASITSDTQTEGTADNNLVHTVTMSTTSVNAETYSFSLTDTTTEAADHGTPTFSNGVTYNTTTGLITVPAGVSTFTVATTVTDDALADSGEYYTLNIGGATATGTILDETNPYTPNDPDQPNEKDAGATVSLSGDASVWEGNTATYTVTTDTVSTSDIIVTVQTQEAVTNPATGGVDYVSVAKDVTILAGNTSATFTVETTDDALADNGENFVAKIISASGAEFEAVAIGNATVTTTIIDATVTTPPPGIPGTPDSPDAGTQLSISGATSTLEGDAVEYTLTVTTAPKVDMIVDVKISNITTNGDVTVETKQVTILANTTSATFTVDNVEDAIKENPEDYKVEIISTTTGGYEAVSLGNTSVTTTITDDDHVPTAINVTARVSEEGLMGGIADTLGTNANADDTTNVRIITGNMATDLDGDALTVSLTAPTGFVDANGAATPMTSNGSAITWVGVGTDTLTGSANGASVITINVANDGNYTVTLLGPVDHPQNSVEDIVSFNLGVQVSDGANPAVNATLNVVIEDDMPTANDITQDVVIPLQDSNIMIMMDVSGSMGTADSGVYSTSGTQLTRLEVAKQGVYDMLDKYALMGNVRVQVGTFATNLSTPNATWMSIAEAKTYVASLTANGGTNYDYGLDGLETMFATSGKIAGAQNISYFFSDGVPTYSDTNPGTGNNGSVTDDGTNGTTNLGDGIDATEAAAWIAFLQANDILSNAVGLGANVTSNYLDPIAYNGLIDTDIDSIIVQNLQDLSNNLNATLPAPLAGDLLSGNVIDSGFGIGADGGYVSQITIGGDVYTYNGTTLSVSGSNNTYTFDAVTNTLVIKTVLKSTLTVDLDDGNYTLAANPTTTASYTELVNFELSDNDGDKASGVITFNITREQVLTDDSAVVYESAMPAGTDSASTAEIATGNILTNDTLPTGSTLTNVSIGSINGVVNGNLITVTTAEGNTLVVDKTTGSYTYTLLNAVDHVTKTVIGTKTLAENTFTGTSLDGWAQSTTVANDTNRLVIDGNGDTATKTFDFGSEYANTTVKVTFAAVANNNWDGGSDDFIITVNGVSRTADSFSASQTRAYDFDIQLDANGKAAFILENSSNNNNEDIYIDNFKITGPEFTYSYTDTAIDSFTYTVVDSQGFDYSAKLDITIHDDKPLVNEATAVSISLPDNMDVNIMFTLDVSGSMSEAVAGSTRLEIAKVALISTINEYAQQGIVNVNLTLFNAQGKSMGWMSSTDAIAYINKLSMNGSTIQYNGSNITGLTDVYTNYEAAVAVTASGYSTNMPLADKTVAFFISDGAPTKEYNDATTNLTDVTNANTLDNVGTGYLDSSYVTAWTNFISSNNIDLEVIGIGTGLDETYLDMVQVMAGKDPLVTTDVSKLETIMLATIESVEGTLYGTDGNAGIVFGADGGHILEMVYYADYVDATNMGVGTTYAYNGANPIQTITLSEGTMDLNFETGKYIYTPTTSSNMDITEHFKVSVTDADGDSTLNKDLSLIIGIDETYVYNGTAIDAGAGFDTITLAANQNLDTIDFSKLDNIEKIDMTTGDHTINNLTLNDVLDMTSTSSNHTLVIEGDALDALNVDTNGWSQSSVTPNAANGTTTYEYSNGIDSVSLVVDDNVPTQII